MTYAMRCKSALVALLLVIAPSCALEEQIESATVQCKEEIAKAVEQLEDTCLTKEEILEIIYAYQTTLDVATDGD